MSNTAFASLNPTRDDFAALLDESYGENEAFEGTVVKGTVVGIEKDVAVIDIGLKTEGRVALREFTGPGREAAPKIGDIVEVYLERVENALGEAVISRDKARREESWVKLEKAFESNEKVDGVIFTNAVDKAVHHNPGRAIREFSNGGVRARVDLLAFVLYNYVNLCA